MADEASKATYKDQARTISALTPTNTELRTTNKKLTEKIVALAEKLAAASKSGGQGASAPPGFESDANQTGSATKLDGVFMPLMMPKHTRGRPKRGREQEPHKRCAGPLTGPHVDKDLGTTSVGLREVAAGGR